MFQDEIEQWSEVCPESTALFVLVIEFRTTHMDYTWTLQDDEGTNYLFGKNESSHDLDLRRSIVIGQKNYIPQCVPRERCYTFGMVETLEFDRPEKAMSYGIQLDDKVVKPFRSMQHSPETKDFGLSPSCHHYFTCDEDESLFELFLAPNMDYDVGVEEPHNNNWTLSATLMDASLSSLSSSSSPLSTHSSSTPLNSSSSSSSSMVFFDMKLDSSHILANYFCLFKRTCVPRTSCLLFNLSYEITFMGETFYKITLDGNVYREKVIYDPSKRWRKTTETTYLGNNDACTADVVCSGGSTTSTLTSTSNRSRDEQQQQQKQHPHMLLEVAVVPEEKTLSELPWYLDHDDGTPSMEYAGKYFGFRNSFAVGTTYTSLLCLPSTECFLLGLSNDCAVERLSLDHVGVIPRMKVNHDETPSKVLYVGGGNASSSSSSSSLCRPLAERHVESFILPIFEVFLLWVVFFVVLTVQKNRKNRESVAYTTIE